MEDAKELARSQQAFRIETYWIIGVAAGTALLAAGLMRFVHSLTIGTYLFSGLLAFVVVMITAWIAVCIRDKRWNDTKYVLGRDALLIKQPNGFTGTTQDIYLYESILSVSFHQGYSGRKYGYGDIEIVIPKLKTSLVLRNVVEPSEQLPILKAHMKGKAGRPRALVT
ncbi:hypothetical protein KW803_02155 [Candidatus Saccharibacteria bacterium]|nr:hypothetical protein [Candidatus Saccharibacteria bacterium]